MSRRLSVLIPIVILLIGGTTLGAFAHNASAHQRADAFQLLIVDETRTFSSSMRVEVFARALKRTGLFELKARIVTVNSSFEDPLRGEEPDRQYDLILIVPAGIDDGTVKQVWIATRPFPQVSEGLREAVGTVKGIADGIFRGVAEAVGVTDDLLPGYFATLFIKEGWL